MCILVCVVCKGLTKTTASWSLAKKEDHPNKKMLRPNQIRTRVWQPPHAREDPHDTQFYPRAPQETKESVQRSQKKTRGTTHTLARTPRRKITDGRPSHLGTSPQRPKSTEASRPRTSTPPTAKTGRSTFRQQVQSSKNAHNAAPATHPENNQSNKRASTRAKRYGSNDPAASPPP